MAVTGKEGRGRRGEAGREVSKTSSTSQWGAVRSVCRDPVCTCEEDSTACLSCGGVGNSGAADRAALPLPAPEGPPVS